MNRRILTKEASIGWKLTQVPRGRPARSSRKLAVLSQAFASEALRSISMRDSAHQLVKESEEVFDVIRDVDDVRVRLLQVTLEQLDDACRQTYGLGSTRKTACLLAIAAAPGKTYPRWPAPPSDSHRRSDCASRGCTGPRSKCAGSAESTIFTRCTIQTFEKGHTAIPNCVLRASQPGRGSLCRPTI